MDPTPPPHGTTRPSESPYPPLETPSRGISVGARVGLGLATLGLAVLTFYLWFIGVITFTGCFIGCGTPQPISGSLLLLGAVAGGTATIVTAWVALSGSSRHLRPVAVAAVAATSLVAVLSVLV